MHLFLSGATPAASVKNLEEYVTWSEKIDLKSNLMKMRYDQKCDKIIFVANIFLFHICVI